MVARAASGLSQKPGAAIASSRTFSLASRAPRSKVPPELLDSLVQPRELLHLLFVYHRWPSKRGSAARFARSDVKRGRPPGRPLLPPTPSNITGLAEPGVPRDATGCTL